LLASEKCFSQSEVGPIHLASTDSIVNESRVSVRGLSSMAPEERSVRGDVVAGKKGVRAGRVMMGSTLK